MASGLTESRFVSTLDALSECSRTCTWDADADIRELDAAMVECARLCLDCADTCDTCISLLARESPPSTAKSVLCAQRYARPVLPSVRNTITTSTAASAPSLAGGVPRSVDRWPLNVGVLRVSDMA